MSSKASSKGCNLMMRESIRFLKMYFIFSGVLSGLISFAGLPQAQENVIGFVFGLVGIVNSTAWVYVGLSFRRLLIESPKAITILLLVGIAFLTLSFLLILAHGLQTDEVGYLIFSLLIHCYLLYNVRCLSAEERSKSDNQ
jgi:uncharacterized membrane protein